MKLTRATDGRVVSGILILLGIFAVVEGRWIYALREQMVAGAVVGDDTFPIIVGVALVVLGLNLGDQDGRLGARGSEGGTRGGLAALPATRNAR